MACGVTHSGPLQVKLGPDANFSWAHFPPFCYSVSLRSWYLYRTPMLTASLPPLFFFTFWMGCGRLGEYRPAFHSSLVRRRAKFRGIRLLGISCTFLSTFCYRSISRISPIFCLSFRNQLPPVFLPIVIPLSIIRVPPRHTLPSNSI